MKQLNLFIEITRLKKPVGFMLLFWPCAWGLTIAYDFSRDLADYFFYLFLFFSGSVLMRSAGCIVNDLSDKKFDILHENISMVTHMKDLGFSVYQGSETDVLDRYYQAALEINADTVVRITGDCPLVDSSIIDEMYTIFKKKN